MSAIATFLAEHRELGLLVALLLGFGFGFVLERAGFGRADKLAAQFYGSDMRVFKVMFSAIVTAMLGVMIAHGAGVIDLRPLAEQTASFTWLWPMALGGFLLGVGFIISGYCPGTSVVAAASGSIDGMFTIGGVVIGSVLFAEAWPLVGDFYKSSELGHLFLYDVFSIPAPVLALLVALMAVGMFIGAEKLEHVLARRRREGGVVDDGQSRALEVDWAPRPRRLIFGGIGGFAVLGLVALAAPERPKAAPARLGSITQAELARRVLDRPWTLRVLDLRDAAACAKRRVPGAECVPETKLGALGLAYAAGKRDLVLVGAGDLAVLPPAVTRYPGKVLRLRGGFAGWKAYALTKPAALAAGADAAARAEWTFRSALVAAMTGRKAAPPPPASIKGYAPKRKKKKGGGC
ncbi:MAG: YeeE/YedE family protein [Myxococcales bacterium]|nr:YeeE/YedE family protein [Myxococcales bacterium]